MNNIRKANNNEWLIIHILPNLSLNESFETEFIAIVPFNDNRIQGIISQQALAAKILTNFRTETGNEVKPSTLLMRSNAPKSIKNSEAVVAFRNCLAVSSLLHGWARSFRGANVFEPIYSDHFDFYPATLNKKGDGLVISTPATMGIWPKVEKFYGQTYPHLPIFEQFKAIPDKLLSEKLLKQWKIRFMKPNKDTKISRLLFRSLEVAYQAMLSPFRHSTLYEYGTHLSLWTSAFEVLAQRGKPGQVGYKDVLKLLGQYRWGEKRLDSKVYKVHKNKNAPKGNLVQKIYRELYDARNDFFHGNPVSESRLYPFRNKERPILPHLAPSLYWVALYVYLPQLKRRKKVEKGGLAVLEGFDRLNYIDVFLSSIGLNLEDLYDVSFGGRTEVVGWKIGTPNMKTGTGFGIRIPIKDRERLFKKKWKSITIQLESGINFEAKLSKAFWGKCPEIRSKWIGKWMIENGLAPWTQNNPPKLKLKSTGIRIFKLSLLS